MREMWTKRDDSSGTGRKLWRPESESGRESARETNGLEQTPCSEVGGRTVPERWKEILPVLPPAIRFFVQQEQKQWGQVQEIRFRVGQPARFLKDGVEIPLPGMPDLKEKDLQELMEYISRFSLYAYEEDIRQGFLTLRGGHRVGLAGKVVLSGNGLRTIRNITFVHIRIAGERIGCAKDLLPYLYQDRRPLGTLIFSAPGQGKTTMMRDLIRLIASGNSQGPAKTVSVIDERGELAACDQGVMQNDLGQQVDVLDGCPKRLGMRMMLRSMAPAVLAVDEISGKEDAGAILEAAGCGCVLLATAHARDFSSLLQQELFQILFRDPPVFQRYVQLSGEGRPGRCLHIYNEKGGVLL